MSHPNIYIYYLNIYICQLITVKDLFV